jgi:hypothetical protein
LVVEPQIVPIGHLAQVVVMAYDRYGNKMSRGDHSLEIVLKAPSMSKAPRKVHPYPQKDRCIYIQSPP